MNLAHLTPDSRELFDSITADYDLEPWHLSLLVDALQSRDRAEQARRALDKDGLTVEGRFGPRPHPLLTVERDQRKLFSALMKQLGLDVEGRK